MDKHQILKECMENLALLTQLGLSIMPVCGGLAEKSAESRTVDYGGRTGSRTGRCCRKLLALLENHREARGQAAQMTRSSQVNFT